MADEETRAPGLPAIPRYKPYYRELKKGRTYAWCACGLSRKQPFCDGSHKGTGFRPVFHTAPTEGEEVLFCGCKHSATKPFCDGSHNNLRGDYELDDPDSPANRAIPEVAPGPDGKARLDGGCFVCSVDGLALERRDGLAHARILGREDGALHQSYFLFRLEAEAGPALRFADRHVVLLCSAGTGRLAVGPRSFALAPGTGGYVRPGEAFRLEGPGLTVYAAVCPLADGPEFLDGLPAGFDDRFPERVVPVDPARRQSMADRFFQMLVDRSVGSDMATQFIGEVPLSKAAPHRHLYEESLVVLRGHGTMWTSGRRTPVRTGDVIFLPRKEPHSLQCTDPGGMMLAGVIYPGDNPSINY